MKQQHIPWQVRVLQLIARYPKITRIILFLIFITVTLLSIVVFITLLPFIIVGMLILGTFFWSWARYQRKRYKNYQNIIVIKK